MIYDYTCPKCGRMASVITTLDKRDAERLCSSVPQVGVDPLCPGVMTRVMSRPHFTMGPNASKFDDANARQKAWKETPEVVEKLRSGEYQEVKAQR